MENVSLSGTILEIIHYNKKFGVIKFSYGKISRRAAGLMCQEPKPGMIIYMEGEWEKHAKWGLQLKIKKSSFEEMQTVPESIIYYLNSGFLYGVGQAMAKLIYEKFGDAALTVIEDTPEQLCEISGITETKAIKIQKSFLKTGQYAALASYLRGATKYQIETIYQQYGENSVALLKENIYRIVRDIDGIGFKKADKLANNCGIRADDPTRVNAAIVYILIQITLEGHCYTYSGSLQNRLRELLKLHISENRFLQELAKLQEQKEIVIEEDAVFLASVYDAECTCSEAINRILTSSPNRTVPNSWVQRAIVEMELENDIVLSDEQRCATGKSMSEKILLLTGGPGSGKTTTVQTILKAWNHPESVLLLAPTGCAAYHLLETTGHHAYTIQRGLEYGYYNGKMGFKYNKENLLPYDLIILDEATMPNIVLMASLLQAVRSGARLVLIGDHDQLPSIGPGKVFHDLLTCGKIPVVRLSVDHRQQGSVKWNVRQIKKGMGVHTWRLDDMFHFFPVESTEEMQEVAVREYYRLVLKYGIENVRCLSAAKVKSKASVESLNPVLREMVNPTEGRKGLAYGDKQFFVNDRVMYMRENNYDKDIFNGESGTVKSIELAGKKMTVAFDDGREAIFSEKNLRNLELSYANTIHKSMGLECKAVVIAYNVPPIMWDRSLLYTAVSRAKKEVSLVGDTKAISVSVENSNPILRNTKLKFRIKE